MRSKAGMRATTLRFSAGIVCAWSVMVVHGEKVLIYDENKGIIFVDKDHAGATTSGSDAGDETAGDTDTRRSPPSGGAPSHRSKHDLHLNRRKDPPRLYFESGLQYYQTEDYANALKNFRHAAERMPRKPEYRLWIGKTYRQLDHNDRMLATLRELVETFPECDVADDALFEIAFYYQQSDHYDSAFQVYARLAEQYPFGVSFASGEQFLDISRDQRRRMRARMLSTLKLLGYDGETLEEAYRHFQEANDLPVSGRGDRTTVRAIFEQHRRRVDEEERQASEAKHARTRRKWLLAFNAAALLSLTATAAARVRLHHLRRHLATLSETLEDLDTRAL
jgi:hypothetical protein